MYGCERVGAVKVAHIIWYGLPEATDHRVPLEQAIGIARETCQGLEFG